MWQKYLSRRGRKRERKDRGPWPDDLALKYSFSQS